MSLITSSSALADFCAEVQQNDFLAVDTEFIRERTFWANPCLIQVAGETKAAAIDVLARNIDLSPLNRLLADPGIVKVFHSARQDIEIFLRLFGHVPAPLFDTQVAAMVCGFGESASFATLAARLAHVKIDKSQRFTNWAQRPLSDEQIAYALSDVVYLRPIYQRLKNMLEDNGREAWLTEEMHVLGDRETYHTQPREAWKRIKRAGDNPRRLAILRELAAWREHEAQSRNVPRQHILRDDVLVEFACTQPKTPRDLSNSRSFPNHQVNGPVGMAVLKAIEKALASPQELWPRPVAKPELPGPAKPLADLLKLLLKVTCNDHGVASKLVASSADIEAMVLQEDADIPALSGWRRDLFGATALNVKQGKCAVVVKKGSIKLIEIPH